MNTNLQIGQRIDVWEVLPNIRYSLDPGSWHAESKPTENKITYINTIYGRDAACANEQLYDIRKEVKKVGTLVIKSPK